MSKPSKTQPRQSYGAESATARRPVTLDAGSGQLAPTPRRQKYIPLNTVDDVKVELAKVYRAARSGQIPPEVASRLTFMLGTLGKLIVDSEHEARLVRLEQEILENEL